MVEFRRMIPVLAVLAFLLGSAVTASAQPSLSCTTNGGVNTPDRAEGLTELVGDFQVTCTGGIPTAPGLAIPTVTIQIFLNTQITSRCMESTSSVGCLGLHSEALLLLDDPAPANQFGCPNNTCLNVGNGLGTSPYGALTQTGAGTAGNPGIAGANKNVFQGIQTAANSITFLGIPIDPPGTSGNRIIRITNIRGNANGLGVASGNNAPTSITETITATPFNFLPVSGLATQAVGSVQLGLDFSLRSTATTGNAFTTVTAQQCVSNPATNVAPTVPIAWLRYRELFSTAFKKRSILASAANPSGTANQDDLTVGTFNTETGFQNSSLTLPFPSVANTAGAALVGQADWGTRLKAVFNGIPAGVRLYVGTDSTSGVSPAPIDTAHLTSAETGAYAAVAAGITELTITNGSATAVWEVLDSDANSFANLNFPVYIRYIASPGTNSPALGTATVNGSYAPISTVTVAVSANVPRFADTSTAKNLFTLVPCVTNLLFPFVTTQLGFDTGLAISATSSDPYGTSLQSGTCTLNWYGAAFTGATPTPVVTAGTTYTTLASTTLSNVAGGFSGYMIAVCRFQYAHGFAFVSDLGARNIAMGYLALIIPDPAAPRTANPFPCGANSGIAGCVASGEQLGQ